MNAVTHGLARFAIWLRNRGKRTRGERPNGDEVWFGLMKGLVQIMGEPSGLKRAKEPDNATQRGRA